MKFNFVLFALVCSAILFSTSEAKTTKGFEQRCKKACALEKDMNDKQIYRGIVNPFDDECYCYPADNPTSLLPMRDPRNHPYGQYMDDQESLFATNPLSMVPGGDCTSVSDGKNKKWIVQSGECPKVGLVIRKQLSQLTPEVANCISSCREQYDLRGGAGICIENKCYCYRIGFP